MTDLEARVRDALLARAGEFAASPDAWQRTTARAGRRAVRRQARRPARQRWLTRLTPLAAAAAVLVIGAGTATLAETGGFSAALRQVGLEPGGTQASQPTPSAGGGSKFQGAGCAFPGETKTIRVAGVQISAKVTLNGVTTWWTRIPESLFPQAKTDLMLCQAHDGGGSGSPEPRLGQGQLVQAGTPTTFLADSSSVSGIAAASVTSVQADLANGNVVRGSVAYGPGFPYAAWWINYLQGISATLVFRDAAGHVVRQIAEPYPPASSPEHKVPAANWVPTSPCQQARVQQVAGGTKVWTYIGFTDPYPVTPAHAAPTLCESTGTADAPASFIATYTMPAGQVARRVFALYPTSSLSGIAVRGVTSVTAVLADGRKYTGTFVTGRLFTYPVWLVSYPLKDPATLVFRNAAGTQVAVLREPANP